MFDTYNAAIKAIFKNSLKVFLNNVVMKIKNRAEGKGRRLMMKALKYHMKTN